MAMILENGQFSGPNGLIDKIRLFLNEQGWTTNLYADDPYRGYGTVPAPLSKRLHLQKGELCWNFRSAQNEMVIPNGYTSISSSGVGCMGSFGFDGAKPWYQQPVAPKKDLVGNAPFGGFLPAERDTLPYWFFYTELSELFFGVVVQNGPETFSHMMLGNIAKYGDWTGGAFTAASNTLYLPKSWSERPGQPSGISYPHWFPFGSVSSGSPAEQAGAVCLYSPDLTPDYPWLTDFHRYSIQMPTMICDYGIDCRNSTSSYNTLTINSQPEAQQLYFIPSSFTGILPLVPIRFCLQKDYRYLTQGRVYVGELQRVFLTRVEGIASGEERSYNGRRFKFFPALDRQAGYFSYGFAYEVNY